MKKIVSSLVVSLSLTSLALASQQDDNLMESGSRRASPQSLTPKQKVESQLQRWEVNLENAKASRGKKSKRVARIQHCSEMVTFLQAELKQLKKCENRQERILQARIINALPSQEEYLKAQSDAYIIEFIPFVKKCTNDSNFINQVSIPDIIRPRTVFHIPHVNGELELELKGSATSCRAHLQSFILDFLKELQKDKKIYSEKNINQMRLNLATWIEEPIQAYNRNAQDNQILRDKYTPQGTRMSTGGGMFSMFTNQFLSANDLMNFITLSELPVIESLTDDDQDRIQNMIQSVQIVKLNPNKEIKFSLSNFQGVQ